MFVLQSLAWLTTFCVIRMNSIDGELARLAMPLLDERNAFFVVGCIGGAAVGTFLACCLAEMEDANIPNHLHVFYLTALFPAINMGILVSFAERGELRNEERTPFAAGWTFGTAFGCTIAASIIREGADMTVSSVSDDWAYSESQRMNPCPTLFQCLRWNPESRI